ncbi:MAG: hypothetical protein P8Y69_13775 [Gammaproteobacteria bacterium]
MSLEITAEALEAFVKRFEAASGSRSFDDVIGMIHPAALFRFNDDDYRGLEAIRRAFEATWAYDIADEQYTLTDIDAMHIGHRDPRRSARHPAGALEPRCRLTAR